jgi:GNAT superfamily N-acetyltransferase
VDGNLVGFVSAHLWSPEPVLEHVVEVFIEYVFVTPDLRRRGLGSALVKHVRDWATRLGATRLRLKTLSRSSDAIAFWEQQGATPFSVEMLLDLGDSRVVERRAPMGFGGNSA